MARRIAFSLMLASLALLPACRSGRSAGRETLVVRGGPLLRDVFPDIVAQFQSQRPDVNLRSDFSCPPCILTDRTSETLDLDVFISAGDVELDLLAKGGLLDLSTKEPIGSAKLVLAVPPGNPAHVKALGDLHRPQIKRVAIGDPETTSPGRYSRQAFERMGLWSEIQDKLVPTRTGCEALKSVVLGQVDAALLYSFCLHDEAGEPVIVQEIPDRLHDPIIVSLTAAPGRKGPATEAFFGFMVSPAAQSALRRAGIGAVPEAGSRFPGGP